MISALYAKILIVMGLAFPMTEVISTNVTSSSYLVSHQTVIAFHFYEINNHEEHVFHFDLCFQAFYLYLYFGSILYFLYVFFALLWYRSGPTDYLKCKTQFTFTLS